MVVEGGTWWGGLPGEVVVLEVVVGGGVVVVVVVEVGGEGLDVAVHVSVVADQLPGTVAPLQLVHEPSAALGMGGNRG